MDRNNNCNILNISEIMYQFYISECKFKKNCTKQISIKIPVELISSAGKIRAVIPTGSFKENLLSQLENIKTLLKKSLIFEALAILTGIIEIINYKIYTKNNKKNGLNAVLGDLLKLKEKLLEIIINVSTKINK